MSASEPSPVTASGSRGSRRSARRSAASDARQVRRVGRLAPALLVRVAEQDERLPRRRIGAHGALELAEVACRRPTRSPPGRDPRRRPWPPPRRAQRADRRPAGRRPAASRGRRQHDGERAEELGTRQNEALCRRNATKRHPDSSLAPDAHDLSGLLRVSGPARFGPAPTTASYFWRPFVLSNPDFGSAT